MHGQRTVLFIDVIHRFNQGSKTRFCRTLRMARYFRRCDDREPFV